jgi:hypothetical protein
VVEFERIVYLRISVPKRMSPSAMLTTATNKALKQNVNVASAPPRLDDPDFSWAAAVYLVVSRTGFSKLIRAPFIAI